MGLDNPVHLLFVLVILLLVFGAKRLPEMGRGLGDGLRGFKDAVTGQSPPEPTVQQLMPVPAAATRPATDASMAGEPVSSVNDVGGTN